MHHRFGSSIIKFYLVFIGFVYVLPISLNFLYKIDDYYLNWEKGDLNLTFILSLLLFSGIFFVFCRKPIKSLDLKNKNILYRLGMKWLVLRKYVVITFLLSSLFWFMDGLSGYRYDGVRISQKLSLHLLIVVVLKSIIYIDLWLAISHAYRNNKKLRYQYSWIINIGLLLSLTGTTSAFYYLFHCGFVFFPNISMNVIRFSYSKFLSNNIFNTIVYVSGILFFTVGLFFVYHFGNIIKTGTKVTVYERYGNLNDHIAEHIVPRISTTYYGHTYMLSNPMEFKTENYLNNLGVQFKNFLYRIDVLLGNQFKIIKPDIASINQLHYKINLSNNQDETSGASPGLIPGFFYFFPPWIAILFGGIFFAKFTRLICYIVPNSTINYNIVSFTFLYEITHAWVELLNPLSSTFFAFIFLISIIKTYSILQKLS